VHACSRLFSCMDVTHRRSVTSPPPPGNVHFERLESFVDGKSCSKNFQGGENYNLGLG
jgi:hypothetical protein